MGGEKKIEKIKDQMTSLLSANSIRVDYISIVDQGNFNEISKIGSNNIINEVEMINIIYDFFKEINFKDFRIRINSRKIINNLLKKLGVNNSEALLVCLDKKDKIGLENVTSFNSTNWKLFVKLSGPLSKLNWIPSNQVV